MENLSHSVRRNQASTNFSKKSHNLFGLAAAKTVYDDVFGGPPKVGLPTISPRPEDYVEIFGSSSASRASSIPVLDLPVVHEPEIWSSTLDYSEIFGCSNNPDFNVSYEELVEQSKGGHGSPDEAGTPVDSDCLSEESDPSIYAATTHLSSDTEPHHLLDDKMLFDDMYHNFDNSNGQGEHNFDSFHSIEAYMTVSDIILRTSVSQVPPPSRPPPVLDVKMQGSSQSASKCKASFEYAFEGIQGGGSPTFLDVEVDATSSSAAMKDAIDKVQASAEVMIDRLEAPHNLKNVKAAKQDHGKNDRGIKSNVAWDNDKYDLKLNEADFLGEHEKWIFLHEMEFTDALKQRKSRPGLKQALNGVQCDNKVNDTCKKEDCEESLGNIVKWDENEETLNRALEQSKHETRSQVIIESEEKLKSDVDPWCEENEKKGDVDLHENEKKEQVLENEDNGMILRGDVEQQANEEKNSNKVAMREENVEKKMSAYVDRESEVRLEETIEDRKAEKKWHKTWREGSQGTEETQKELRGTFDWDKVERRSKRSEEMKKPEKGRRGGGDWFELITPQNGHGAYKNLQASRLPSRHEIRTGEHRTSQLDSACEENVEFKIETEDGKQQSGAVEIIKHLSDECLKATGMDQVNLEHNGNQTRMNNAGESLSWCQESFASRQMQNQTEKEVDEENENVVQRGRRTKTVHNKAGQANVDRFTSGKGKKEALSYEEADKDVLKREEELIRKLEEEREREKDRMAVEIETHQTREKAERAAAASAAAVVERVNAETQQRALMKPIERLEKPCVELRFKSVADKLSVESRPQEYADIEGESSRRCRARLERHQRTAERAARALAEKNMRDVLAQREQAERIRVAETVDGEVKRWSNGKEGNLRALLSTLQYILGPGSGWKPIPLTDIITAAAVKKAYRKATLCVHPDKLQQRGVSIQQRYICEKVFDILKEAWNKFNSQEW